MTLKRRDFIKLSAGSTAGAALLAGCATPVAAPAEDNSPLSKLQSMTKDIVPITKAEREQRIEKAQRLMAENKIQHRY